MCGSYDGPKAAMVDANQHAASSLKDESASKNLAASVKIFEKTFEKAFEDLEEWLLTGAAGKQLTIDAFGKLLPQQSSFLFRYMRL